MAGPTKTQPSAAKRTPVCAASDGEEDSFRNQEELGPEDGYQNIPAAGNVEVEVGTAALDEEDDPFGNQEEPGIEGGSQDLPAQWTSENPADADDARAEVGT